MTTARRIQTAFHRSMTVTVCLSSCVLAMAEGSFLPVGLTPLIAGAAFWFNDYRRQFMLPTLAANILGLLAMTAAVVELAIGGQEARILALVHLVVYITWIVLFMKKLDRQSWWLFALTVLQLALSTVLTRSPLLASALITLLFVQIWTLSLFTLHRLQQRVTSRSLTDAHPETDTSSQLRVLHGIQSDAGTNWLGLRFRLMIFGLCIASLAMSGVVFAVFPRVFVGSPLLAGSRSDLNAGLVNRTGFRETVSLGEFGPILSSNQRVLQLSVFRQLTGAAVTMEEFVSAMQMEELLLRGTTMGWYDKGEWSRGPGPTQQLTEFKQKNFGLRQTTADSFRLEMTQDPPIGNFAFAPANVTAAALVDTKGRIVQRSHSSVLLFELAGNNQWNSDQRSRFNKEPISFHIHCVPPDQFEKQRAPFGIPAGLQKWLFPNGPTTEQLLADDRDAASYCLTGGIQRSLPRLSSLAAELCTGQAGRLPADECARRIVQMLRDSDEYTYSLDPPRIASGQDPVEEFLLTHKEGHCQYFASAGALMLQSVGIPARIVNGFKGTEMNPISRVSEVRQKHAHVWIEYRHNHRWQTIDPTPGARQELLSSPQNQNVLANLQDAVSDMWQAGMDNVTAERQREFVAPILDAIRSAAAAIRKQGIIGALKSFFQNVLQDPSRWFNWRVFVGVIAVLLPTVWVSRHFSLRWSRRILRWLRQRWNPEQRTATSIVRFYEAFRKACAHEGFQFRPSQTASENAESARQHFADRLDEQTASIPAKIADAFNAVRYGQHVLSDEQTAALRQDVANLTQRIRARTSQ